ncbi:MAG TPA: NRAMP family divalent metal transporter [Candidatus Saccharimonadales bacterium]|nr:NRAMP family divalent metal transporter [Candidatus Saccharimonadales bacterium]
MAQEKTRKTDAKVAVRSKIAPEGSGHGDIRGAFGTIGEHDAAGGRSWRRRLLALAVIVGPGLIVMVGDNDAGGVSTYAAAGQNYGTSLLWTLLLLIPVLIVNQEMVARLGAVSGVGHGRLIFERFGKIWGRFAVSDLFVLNFLTIATEFIGISLGAQYFGVPAWVAVPLAGVVLVGITVTGRFETWERLMFVLLFGNLLCIPLMFLSHPTLGPVVQHFVIPGVEGGFKSDGVLLIVAIVGTTVTPWQLFFQQSNVVDKRITPRWIPYERADTVIGALVVVIGATAIMVGTAFAFSRTGGGTGNPNAFTNAYDLANGLKTHVGPAMGAIFSILLIDASVVGASAVTLCTSYAFGDTFGIRNSLHRSWREARPFYAMFTGIVTLAAVFVLIPGVPLGLVTTAVQALAGVMLPSACLFLLFLCNDRDVLGPWVNRPWFNLLASVILGVLLILSIILVVSTILPHIDVARLFLILAAVMLVGLVIAIAINIRARRALPRDPRMDEDRETWRMPSLALLNQPVKSRGRLIALCSVRGYAIVAMVSLLVKTILASRGGH